MTRMTANTSQLLLTRIDHEAKMLNVMRNLFEDGHLTDVTLACEGQLIHAHKLILSSVSNYFQTIFQNPALKSQNNPVIMVKDMKMDDLKAIIEFVYSGEVRICGDQLESLVKSAETLDISGLNRVDPNPANNKTSQSPDTSMDSTKNNVDLSSFVKKSTNGSIGKSQNISDDPSISRKESGTNSRTSCDKKTDSNSSIRGIRNRCPEVTEKVGNGRELRSRGTSQENIASCTDANSKSDESLNRETRYLNRARITKLKEDMNRSILGETKMPTRDRLSTSSVSEATSKSKTSTDGNITNGDQTKNENECLKDVNVDQNTNISNQTPEFKKPQQRTRKCKKTPETVYPPAEANEDYMRQFVCNKERLSMNLKRDDDVQSVSSVTTRSHRNKLMEELVGCDKTNSLTHDPPQNTSPIPSNRSGNYTRAKKPTTSSKSGPRGKRIGKVESLRSAAPNLSVRITRQRCTEGAVRWKARAAKLKAVAATRRLAAKSRNNRVDLKTWFDNQAKILQNATGKPRVRKEERTKQTERGKIEENVPGIERVLEHTETTAQPTTKSTSISHMPNPFARKPQEHEPNPLPEVSNNQNNSSQLSAERRKLVEEYFKAFALEFAPKPKRKINEANLDPDPSKRDQTNSQTSPATRSLRPKRTKTTSDSSDNPPSTTNTSGASLYTTVSLSPSPTSSNPAIPTQPAGDPSI